jgi:hypothetical protein
MSGVAGRNAPPGVQLLPSQRWCTCMQRCVGGKVVADTTFRRHQPFRQRDEEDPGWWMRAMPAPQEDMRMDEDDPDAQQHNHQMPDELFEVQLDFIIAVCREFTSL